MELLELLEHWNAQLEQLEYCNMMLKLLDQWIKKLAIWDHCTNMKLLEHRNIDVTAGTLNHEDVYAGTLMIR